MCHPWATPEYHRRRMSRASQVSWDCNDRTWRAPLTPRMARWAEHAPRPFHLPKDVFLANRILVQRLNAYDPTLVVHVPDRHGIGGIINPCFAVDTVGFGQHVFRPLLGFRVEASIAPGVHFAGPDLAILVDLRAVERCIGRRQAVLENPLLARVELYQHAAATPGPIVSLRIELAARGSGIGACIGLEHFGGFGVHHHQAVTGPCAAAEISSVPAHCTSIGAGELLEDKTHHRTAGQSIDLSDFFI